MTQNNGFHRLLPVEKEGGEEGGGEEEEERKRRRRREWGGGGKEQEQEQQEEEPCEETFPAAADWGEVWRRWASSWVWLMCRSEQPDIGTSDRLKNIKTAISVCGPRPPDEVPAERALDAAHMSMQLCTVIIFWMLKIPLPEKRPAGRHYPADVHWLHSFLVNKVVPMMSGPESSFCIVTCLLFMLFLSSVFILHLINNNLSYYYDILVHDLHPQMYIVKFSLPQHLNKEKENVQQYQLMEGDLTHSWLIIGIINV